MSDFLSQIILLKVPISELLKRYSKDFSEGSSLFRCVNPSHNDSTPSMRLYKDTNTIYCFGCGFAANPISLVAKMEEVTPFNAMLLIKDWFNIEEDLSQLSLVEKSKVQLKAEEFNKTFSFYMKKLQGKGVTKQDLEELESIFQIKDIRALKDFYLKYKNK